MAKSLKSLVSSTSKNPPVAIFYGVDGVGKTSLAAEFPDPIYLHTDGERTPDGVDLKTPGTIESFPELLDLFGELLQTKHDRKTVIVDSLDGLESLVWGATCQRLGVSSIEEPGYGKGYVEADTEWSEYLQAVGALAQSGMAVVQLAHPEIVRFDSPTTDPYSRYSIKLHKRANALVRERADIVGFVNYRITLKEKEVGFNKKVTRAQGGRDRNIYLQEDAGFVAKNRYSMPEYVPFKQGKGYAELSKFFPQPTGVAA